MNEKGIISQHFNTTSLHKGYPRRENYTGYIDQRGKELISLRYHKYNIKLFSLNDFEKFETLQRDNEIHVEVFPAYGIFLCLFACPLIKKVDL